MIYKFDCVEINDDLDLFQIKQGTLGTFKINDIKNIKIAYEQADFKGKTKPFLQVSRRKFLSDEFDILFNFSYTFT